MHPHVYILCCIFANTDLSNAKKDIGNIIYVPTSRRRPCFAVKEEFERYHVLLLYYKMRINIRAY